MKLGLVLLLADRGLFRMLALPFAIVAAVELGSAFVQCVGFLPGLG